MGGKPKICLTTYFNPRFGVLGALCVASLKKYAKRHGYEVKLLNHLHSDRHPSWNKILVIQELFKEGYDFVFWVDADALFATFETDIADEIEPDKDIYIFRHQMPKGTMPNFGVFLLRNSAWSKDMLTKLWAMDRYKDHIWWENAAFDDLFGLVSLLPEEHRKRFAQNPRMPNEELLKKVKWLEEKWNYGIIRSTKRFKKYIGLNFWWSCFTELTGSDTAVIKHYPGTAYPVRLFALSIAAYRASLISLIDLLKNIYSTLILHAHLAKRTKRIMGMPVAWACNALHIPIPKRQFLPFLLRVLHLGNEGVEVGVGEGIYSNFLLEYSDLILLHSVDPWKKYDEGIYRDIYNDSEESIEKKYQQAVRLLAPHICRNNIMRMTSQEAVTFFENESLDFVYIDANHDYHACKEDLAVWWPKVKKGGLFAGHDYLNGELPSGRYGVKKAVDEFMGKIGQTPYVTPEAWPTWYIIKK